MGSGNQGGGQATKAGVWRGRWEGKQARLGVTRITTKNE